MRIKKDSFQPLSFGDLTIYDYTANLDTSSSLALLVIPPKGGHPKSRSKVSDKYYYVKSGIVSFVVENKEFVLYPGDLLIVEKNRWFSYQNKSNSLVELILMHTPRFSLKQEEFEKVE